MIKFTQPYQIKRSVQCPECKTQDIDVNPRPSTPLDRYCVICNLCGAMWRVALSETDAELTLVETYRSEPGYVLLRYTAGGKLQYVVVAHPIYLDEKNAHPREHALDLLRLTYNEQVNPKHFLKVLEISLDGELDPLRTYEFVTYVSRLEVKERFGFTWEQLLEFDHGNAERYAWPDVFPEMSERRFDNDPPRDD